jgi:hypothetical protein
MMEGNPIHDLKKIETDLKTSVRAYVCQHSRMVYYQVCCKILTNTNNESVACVIVELESDQMALIVIKTLVK